MAFNDLPWKFLHIIPKDVADMIRNEVPGVECLTLEKDGFTIKKAHGIGILDLEKGIMEIFEREGVAF